MSVALKAPTMATKTVLGAPEARYAQPEATSRLHCALVTRLNLAAQRRRLVPEDILSSGFLSGRAAASNGARGCIVLGASNGTD